MKLKMAAINGLFQLSVSAYSRVRLHVPTIPHTKFHQNRATHGEVSIRFDQNWGSKIEDKFRNFSLM